MKPGAVHYKLDDTGQMRFISGGNVLTGSGATGGESGMPWQGIDPSAKNRHWAIPGFLAEQMPPDFTGLGVLAKLDALYDAGLVIITDTAEWPVPLRYLRAGDGQPATDIWAAQPGTERTLHGTNDVIDADVQWMGPTDPDRLGYQTQKPVGILERIIRTSCPPSGMVLDPFCGCGTTIEAAQKLSRNWTGIDITYLAVNLIKYRLSAYPDVQYSVTGEPTDDASARQLAADDPYQFQFWALGLVGARPAEEKKGPDKGVDGRLFFHEEHNGPTKQIVFSVKAGKNIHRNMVHELRGVIEREGASIGVLITMGPPTKPMREEAASAGFYETAWGTRHPRVQIITVTELLDGRRLDTPGPMARDATIKRALPKPVKKSTRKNLTPTDPML